MSRVRPRVSIGVPVFNGERYLAEALDSILAQTFSDFEVIISDNASSDRTGEICSAYAAKDCRVRYNRNYDNLGAAKNFNLVFELARGEYFKWASHDDMIGPDVLAKCVEVLDGDPSVVLCCPKATIIDDAGRVLKNYDVRLNTDSHHPQTRLRDLICTRHMFFQFFGLIRTSTLREMPHIGNFAASDTVLLARLVLSGRFYEIPEYLLLSRSHEEQSAKTLPTHQRVTFSILSRFFGIRPVPHADWFDPRRKGQPLLLGWKIYLANFLAGPLPPAEWFDPRKRGWIVFPYWRLFFEHMISIRSAQLSRRERMGCYLNLGQWLGKNCHRMARDLCLAALQSMELLFAALMRGKGVNREVRRSS